MQSYSELECAFFVGSLSVGKFLAACEFIRSKGFDLDMQSPGYVCDDDFEYPEWKSFEQACDQIRKGNYDSYCINFNSTSTDNICFNKLSLEAEVESACISLKVGEEAFVDQKLQKIVRDNLLDFVRFSQKIAPLISVRAWKIAQTGFDYDLDDGKSFINYISKNNYPASDIDKTIAWYDDEYLSRWQ